MLHGNMDQKQYEMVKGKGSASCEWLGLTLLANQPHNHLQPFTKNKEVVAAAPATS